MFFVFCKIVCARGFLTRPQHKPLVCGARKALLFDCCVGAVRIGGLSRDSPILFCVRPSGFEPELRPWQGRVLPLYYGRENREIHYLGLITFLITGEWARTDSNRRSLRCKRSALTARPRARLIKLWQKTVGLTIFAKETFK